MDHDLVESSLRNDDVEVITELYDDIGDDIKNIRLLKGQVFDISMFTLVYTLSCIIPLVLPFGMLLFWVKFFVDKHNLVSVFRFEYESDVYIRRLIWIFTVSSVAFFPLTMSVIFFISNDDTVISLAFILLMSTIVATIYFISTEAWRGKVRESAKPPADLESEEDKALSDEYGDLKYDRLKLPTAGAQSPKKGNFSDRFQVEGMDTPKSPFQSLMEKKITNDAYLHP
jgi:hypothetical protein